MSERRFYKISPDSPVMAVINAAIHREQEFQRAALEAKDKYGADAVRVSSGWSKRVTGFAFDHIVPEGWRKDKRGACVPNKKIKTGKVLEAEIEALPEGVGASKFSSMLHVATNGEFTYWGGGHVYWTTFEQIGEQFILSVPDQCKVEPKGCTLLKMSEYWKMKEVAA